MAGIRASRLSLRAVFGRLALVRFVIGLLVVAVPVYGTSGTLLGVLGPAHRHEAPAPANEADATLPGVDDLERWAQQGLSLLIGERSAQMLQTARLLAERDKQAQTRAPAGHAGTHTHTHWHGLIEHHHHDAGDATVVVIGAVDAQLQALGDAAAIASTLLPFVPPSVDRLVGRPEPTPTPWPRLAASRWADSVVDPLDRPPRR